MSYPYGGGGGYPPQQPGGYGGYPQAQPTGYPAQGGGMPQPGMPQPGGYYGGAAPNPGYPQAGMPMPGGGGYPQAGGLPYPTQPPEIGFGAPGGGPPPGQGMPTPGGAGYGQPPYGGANYSTPQPSYPQASFTGPTQPPGYPSAGHPAQPAYPNSGSSASQPLYPNVGQPAQPSYPQSAQGRQPSPAKPSQPTGHGSSSYKTVESGTVRPVASFNADNDAQILRKAMKGFGTDEKAIIDVLANRSNEQRIQITTMFKTMFGKDLIKDLKSELSGNFEDAVLALMTPKIDYDASEIHRAIKGLGTDEDAIIEIMCSRSNKEILEIKAAYKRLFSKDLEKDLMSDTSGHFRRLMVSMATGGRLENDSVDIAKAQQQAKELFEAGEKQLGTDESCFNRILASQSFPQLRAVFDEYSKISRRHIEDAIKSEMSGDLEKGMLTIVKCVKNRPAYFAEKLYKSMKGLGTDDRTLIRVVVTRCEVDMIQIKQEFQKAYGKTLESFIKDDCSGDYKRILLALVC